MGGPSQSWSSILQGILKSTAERQRLAATLGVTHMTLIRWASGEYKPQRNHLIHLIQAVHPNHRYELIDALQEQFPDIHSWLTEDTTDQIPPDFYAQVLNIRTTTTENLRFWRIADIVLKQALTQLDPNHMGMAIKLVQCMPPSKLYGNKVRSLRERMGKGTPPWTTDLEHDTHFLGLESLAGYSVEVRRIVSEEDLRTSRMFPAHKTREEVSAAAHPIRFEGNVAGCLLACSAQVGYFTQQRLNLLVAYSDLISLAFNKGHFYSPNQIELRPLPLPMNQRPHLIKFRKRVTDILQANYDLHMTNDDAEMMAWQEIENDLLKRD